MQNLNLSDVALIDIKKDPITSDDLTSARSHVATYMDLLNTRARKLKDLTKSYKEMTEDEVRNLILSDYTFLKRPLFLSDSVAIAGNSKSVIAELEAILG